jgi:hypothetical protein
MRLALPADLEVSAIASASAMDVPALRGSLLAGTSNDPAVVRIGRRTDGTLGDAEWWLRGLAGPVRSIVVSPEGLVYVAVPGTVFRIDPRSR